MSRLALAASLSAVFAITGCGSSQTQEASQPALTVNPPPAPPPPPEPPSAPPANGASAASECESDADCVPAACCHASACTAKASAPKCQDTMCTEECRSGTIDCGGSCYCDAGKCAAKLMSQQ